ncbi:MAG: glycoside hydrolase family 5 protein [Frankia sp.]
MIWTRSARCSALAALAVAAIAGCGPTLSGAGGSASGSPTATVSPTNGPTSPAATPTAPTPTPTTVPTATPTIAPTSVAPTPAAPTNAPAATAAMSGLHVSGTSILDGSGQAVRLLGVDRAGTEYACIQNWGIFDGPSDEASVAAMAAWKINTVRVPLNEDCWLGINGAPAAYSGDTYRQAIAAYVKLLRAHGMAVVLDLHWNAPGTAQATGQRDMADADHSPDFWKSVATAYAGDTGVLFDLYNEPHDITWACWRDGGECGTGYQTTGMQSLLDAVRSTGAKNVVLAGGLNWGGDVTGWLANRPTDPTGNLVASIHSYNFSGCNTTSCLDSQVGPVAAAVPVVAGEIGENDCAATYINQVMGWLDAHHDSYLAWAWNTYGCDFPGLVTDYQGTPTAMGTGLRAHLIAQAG